MARLQTESTVVADEKPRGVIVIRQTPRRAPASDEPMPFERIPHKRSRNTDELEPLAKRVAENSALMERFRAVVGSNDEQRAADITQEITKYAQELDPNVTYDEGTSIALVLLNSLDLKRGRTNG
jgi:hypothetical protein